MSTEADVGPLAHLDWSGAPRWGRYAAALWMIDAAKALRSAMHGGNRRGCHWTAWHSKDAVLARHELERLVNSLARTLAGRGREPALRAAGDAHTLIAQRV